MRLPLDLGFESHPHDRARMVRRDARDTEISAAAAVERRLNESHEAVRAAFRKHGSLTDSQLEQLPEFAEWGPSSARKRRGELMLAGELQAVGDARNSRGRTMVVWGLRPPGAAPAAAIGVRDVPRPQVPPAPAVEPPAKAPRTIAHGDRVRIRGTRELAEVVGIENEFEPAFARRYRVHRSVDLFTGSTT